LGRTSLKGARKGRYAATILYTKCFFVSLTFQGLLSPLRPTRPCRVPFSHSLLRPTRPCRVPFSHSLLSKFMISLRVLFVARLSLFRTSTFSFLSDLPVTGGSLQNYMKRLMRHVSLSQVAASRALTKKGSEYATTSSEEPSVTLPAAHCMYLVDYKRIIGGYTRY
jgi:hypothetical protein